MSNLDKRVASLESMRAINQSLLSPIQMERIFSEVCFCHGIEPIALLKSHGSLHKATAALIERLERPQ